MAEQYIGEFGNLAKENNTMILPSNLTDVSSMVAAAMSVIEQQKGDGKSAGGQGREGAA